MRHNARQVISILYTQLCEVNPLDPIKKRQQQKKKQKKKQLLIYSRFSEGLVREITLRQIDPIVTLCTVFYRIICVVSHRAIL